MKIQWSVFFSFLLLFTLVSCGGEEFGSTPQSAQNNPDALKSYSHSSCSTYTLIKPKVDVLYVIDNSSSSYYIPDSIKTTISQTVNKLSSSFDYRIISTPLLETAQGNNDYQVLTNSSEPVPNQISSAAEFNFKRTPIAGMEQGLGRIHSFMNAHKGTLFRNNAYHIIVLVSNGRDLTIEEDAGFQNGETIVNTANWNQAVSNFTHPTSGIRSQLNSIQLRLISVTAKSVCQTGYRTAKDSYAKMSKLLYDQSGATDNDSLKDSYDICGNGVGSIFAAVNNSIKQVVLNHQYSYWPITFAENNEMVDLNEIRVHKVSSNGTSVELTRGTHWNYDGDPATSVIRTVNTRTGPVPTPGVGEPVTGRHFIAFTSPIVYPDCVLVTSRSRVEYFQYVVLPQQPKPGTVALRINGQLINSSKWIDETATVQTINIKAAYPNPGDQNPPVIKTGFMLKLKNSSDFYKSGDNVQVDYIPQGI